MPQTQTAPPPAKPTSRLGLTLGIYNKIRKEKDPPLARYCAILSLAAAGKPCTAHQITLALGDLTARTGTLDSAIRAGLVARDMPIKGAAAYSLTPAGITLANQLANPEPR